MEKRKIIVFLRSRKGITLVEMMVGMIVLSIFILAVGMILLASSKFWNGGWTQVKLQSDASYAFSRIEKVAREASRVLADPGGGSTLQLTREVGGVAQWTRIFQLSGDTLKLDAEDIISGVSNLSFAYESENAAAIVVNLTLQEDDSQTVYRTTIFLRNSL
ncbi:MAG: prepilin-type N-terminal cleavage/methylation domain-containing protein [Candidatus Ratteibacteria bacterium]|nr:prepilin-type N-terminal cleavage/methylation domain-containing protein [Candidatus Ratteibacteria bacterium]